MAQRVYKPATIFNARMVGMRNLWEPSREYMGKPTDKPNYLVTVIIPKTRALWWEEPVLNDYTKAANELYTAAMSHTPFAQIGWPCKDGDVTDPGRAQADWRRNAWVLTGSSTSPITVTINQNGVPVPLMNRAQVKPGDFVAVGISLAVNSNNPRAVKCYCNTVMFMGPGEEIAVGNSVSAAELMEQAKAQGLNVTGYGGGGAPQQGFGSAPTGGFAHQPAPVQPGQSVPFPSNSGPIGVAPPPVQPPGQQPSFAAPGGFNAPTGFPPR
jgi:hypothetical protein